MSAKHKGWREAAERCGERTGSRNAGQADQGEWWWLVVVVERSPAGLAAEQCVVVCLGVMGRLRRSTVCPVGVR